MRGKEIAELRRRFESGVPNSRMERACETWREARQLRGVEVLDRAPGVIAFVKGESPV